MGRTRTISHPDFFTGRRRDIAHQGGLVNSLELSVIERLIDVLKVESVLEIGVNQGLTARAILEACPTVRRYVGIDISHKAFKKTGSYQLSARDFRDKSVAHAVKGEPRFALHLSDQGSGDYKVKQPFDMVFIDGNHSYGWVKRDTDLAKSAKPAIIVWHDYGLIGDVTRVVDEEGGALYVAKTKVTFKLMNGFKGISVPSTWGPFHGVERERAVAHAISEAEPTPRAKALLKRLQEHRQKRAKGT